jgi:RNA polymerase sigma-70 factor (ECF subfamily)
MSSTFPADSTFETTQWSRVLAAGQVANGGGQKALAELCAIYWYPLYALLRRRGHKAEKARDLTQGFFTVLLEKQYLAAADPARGRFRSFLRTALERFVANEHEHAQAKKRGGGKLTLQLDFDDGERRYQHEPLDRWTPERIFERQWALTLLDRTLAELRQQHDAAGKIRQFEAFKVYLTGDAGAPSVRQAAEQLAISEGAAKVAIHRVRQKYRDLLRAEIAQTVADGQEIDDELRVLLAALRGE